MRPENSQDGQKGKERTFIEKARRAQIIGAAVQTIDELGYGQASLAQIAKRAGISKGVISYHFTGKDELMEQLVEHVYTAIIEAIVPQILAQEDLREALRTHILAVAEYMREHPAELNALGEVFGNFRTADGSLRYGPHTSVDLYEGLEQMYRAGQKAGVFRPFDTRVMAVTVQASIDAMFAYWNLFPDTDLMAHARELADIFDHATRAEPGAGADGAGPAAAEQGPEAADAARRP
ncbi:TetR/AcrR family transcriptional regulator [Nocardiopsis sediminis]|uniref:TetR/AcrR family transcriptional regulator n=1 Tax=Nocardiopsis sediminis TaxID=1778267 RepID=A0ABV8FQL9_9ACTN